MAAILNPAKLAGDKKARIIQRVVDHEIVFVATDGQMMMAGEATIGGRREIVVKKNGASAYFVLSAESAIRVRGVVPSVD